MSQVPEEATPKRLLKKPKTLKKVTADEQVEEAAPSTSKLPVKRNNWEAARRLFVERMDPVSLRDVSDAMGISYGHLRNKAAEERWTTQRADFQAKAALENQKNRIKRLVRDGEAFDDQALQAAKVGMSLIAGRMAQIAQLFGAQQAGYNNAIQRLKAGLPVAKEELYGAFYAKDMGEMARSLELFQKVGKLAIGIDTANINPQDLLEQTADEVEDISIADELAKPDEDRLASFLEAMERTGALDILLGKNEEIFDAEVVEDESNAPNGDTTEETP